MQIRLNEDTGELCVDGVFYSLSVRQVQIMSVLLTGEIVTETDTYHYANLRNTIKRIRDACPALNIVALGQGRGYKLIKGWE